MSNNRLRTILNANQHGIEIPRGSSPRKGGGPAEPKVFRPFIPIAVGAIGKLPRPLKSRSITLRMRKKPEGVQKLQADAKDYQFVEIANLVLGAIMRWSENIILDRKPDLSGLDNRYRDNWKVLISIAEAMGRGDKAREVAKAMIAEDLELSDGVQLLIHIRIIFDRLKVDRIEKEHLLRELHKFEDTWGEWGPSPLTKNRMLAMLRDYYVPAVHPVRIDGKLVQGWYRRDFEEAWKSC
jgi:hypothetical protein